jgi:hypothetical protein
VHLIFFKKTVFGEARLTVSDHNGDNALVVLLDGRHLQAIGIASQIGPFKERHGPPQVGKFTVLGRCRQGWMMLLRTAYRTSSMIELIPNLRISEARCVSTVFSLTRSALATCLLVKPSATS